MNALSRFPKLSESHRRILVLLAVSVLALGGFLWASQRTLGLGFPLDDAWIHQTYARNLAQLGQWSFVPGRPSAGSTAPLWSVLLSIGYLMGIPPTVWAYLWGGLALWGVACMGDAFGRRLFPGSTRTFPWIGLFLAGEWHLVWAAGSGMETLPFSLVIVLLFWTVSRDRFHPFWAGLLCGLSVWLRPDGLTLLGPVLLVGFFRMESWKERIKMAAAVLVGAAVGILPYFGFNWSVSGNPWPNTLYAKQAEYAVRLVEAYPLRLSRLLSLPWIGAGVTLLPGFIASLWFGWARRQWVLLAAAFWWLGYTGIYAAVLPVDYQHGRYLIPAMPIFFVLGAAGTLELIHRIQLLKLRRMARLACLLLVSITWVLFCGQGAAAYASDVAIIETEMVAAGKWIATSLPPDALLAVHDIGAVGYYGNHVMVDLAGLVSPQVIPFIRDEQRLSEYLDQQQVDYLVTFPGWYPDLVKHAEPIYQTGGRFSPQEGGENMNIYRWKQGRE